MVKKFKVVFEEFGSKLDKIDETESVDYIVDRIISMIKDIEMHSTDIDAFNGAIEAFSLSRVYPKTLLGCLCIPSSYIPFIRTMNIGSNISKLMIDPKIYGIISKIHKIHDITFGNVFKYDDISSAKRATVGYILDVPAESYPNASNLFDLQLRIRDTLYDIANRLKSKIETFCSLTVHEIVESLIDILHADSIGDDDIGLECFYNVILTKRNIAGIDLENIDLSLYQDILTDLDRLGTNVISDFESMWGSYPERLMLYTRVKLLLFRTKLAIKSSKGEV